MPDDFDWFNVRAQFSTSPLLAQYQLLKQRDAAPPELKPLFDEAIAAMADPPCACDDCVRDRAKP